MSPTNPRVVTAGSQYLHPVHPSGSEEGCRIGPCSCSVTITALVTLAHTHIFAQRTCSQRRPARGAAAGFALSGSRQALYFTARGPTYRYIGQPA
jgi:hypothetical protein